MSIARSLHATQTHTSIIAKQNVVYYSTFISTLSQLYTVHTQECKPNSSFNIIYFTIHRRRSWSRDSTLAPVSSSVETASPASSSRAPSSWTPRSTTTTLDSSTTTTATGNSWWPGGRRATMHPIGRQTDRSTRHREACRLESLIPTVARPAGISRWRSGTPTMSRRTRCVCVCACA